MMGNATLKYIPSITRCESIEYTFFRAANVLNFFCGLYQSQSLKIGCSLQSNT